MLEVGSGTAQHAVFFAQQFPNLCWQVSDLPTHLDAVRQRIKFADLPNLPTPMALNVVDDPWPSMTVDAVFSANTLHIMNEAHVPHFFRGAGQVIAHYGWLVVYGPFKYDGRFTSASNARFDLMLREADPVMGIRDFEAIDTMAQRAGFVLHCDHIMPANNQCLIWRKSASA